MKISFRVKEILAHIFVYVTGLTMPGILIIKGIADHELSWIVLLLILFFIYILIDLGLYLKRLLNWYRKIPAIVINSERISTNTYWNAKHIYWHQITDIKLDEPRRTTLPRNVRFTVLTNNGRKTIKVNTYILNIDVNDLMWALHQYHKNRGNYYHP